MTPRPFVSIVVATHNRRALLAQTLHGLARQRWPADRLEILVADNGSTDGTREVVAHAATRLRPGDGGGPPAHGAPVRYLWRQLIADAGATVRAALAGDAARRFAAAVRVLWFAGYLRESWFGATGPIAPPSPASPPIARTSAEGP